MKDAAPLSLGYGMGWQNEEIFSRSNKTKHEVETSVLERNLRRGSERATRHMLPCPRYEHCPAHNVILPKGDN